MATQITDEDKTTLTPPLPPGTPRRSRNRMIAAAGAGGALLLAAVAALAIVVINNSSAHVKVAKVAVVTDSYPLKLGSTLTPVVRSQPHPLQRARGARRLADNDPGK